MPLDPVAIEEWADSLKNYDQGQNCLHYDGQYCCLGVLAKEAGELNDGECRGSYACIGDNGQRIMRLLGESLISLSNLNDHGKTFDYIANRLRQAAIKLYDWHGYTVYLNDGLWRVALPPFGHNVIEPAKTIREAHERLLKTL